MIRTLCRPISRAACCSVKPPHQKTKRCVAARASSGQLNSLLDRPWLLRQPDVELTYVELPSAPGAQQSGFHVIRDDLIHPFAGTKLRKLDALLPQLLADGVTDVVTCGGVQSAHIATVAAVTAQHGIVAHLLVRGERPAVPTGFHLLAGMFGDITSVPRSEYADRQAMFESHTARIEAQLPATSKVATIAEGASEAWAIPGLIRLVQFLGNDHSLASQPLIIVIDSGTGTTAIGFAIGVALLQLPWRVQGVQLAGTRDYYDQQADRLTQEFSSEYPDLSISPGTLPLDWVERSRPRRFGKVLAGEIAACRAIARAHGILLDPIYSLAAWEVAQSLSPSTDTRVVMLHAGGGLALDGLAQRMPDQF